MADISLRDLPDAFNRGEFTAGENIAAGNVVAWNASTSSIELIAKTEITDPQNSTTLIRNPVYYNTVESNQFGYCLASDEKFLLVGVPYQNTADNDEEGVVYVYDAQTLAFITTLSNPFVSSEGSHFGFSIAVCGGYAVVGARYDSEVATRAGKIFLYETNNWTLINTVANPNVRSNSSYDYFGTSVFINDTYYGGGSVGEKAADLTAGSGAVWVYDIATNTGYFIDNPNIGTNQAYDAFGHSTFISCDSNHLVVGAQKEDDSISDQGAAYVFDLDSGTPTSPLYSIIGPNVRSGSSDLFGASVHINSSTFAVGAPGEANTAGVVNSGAVFVYSTSTGSLLRTIFHPDDAGGDRFGFSVWQTDDYLYAGTIGFDELGFSNVGSVYQFDNTGTLGYTFKASNTHTDHLTVSLGVGTGLTATNDRLFIGAPGYQSGAQTEEGIVYTYNLTETNANKWIGIAQENIVSGEVGTVNLIGAVDKNQTSLNIGSEYYVKGDGTISRNNTIYGKIGLAISETDLVLYTNTDTSNLASISYVDAVKVSNLTELGIDDGTASQVLSTDGAGNFSFVTLTGVTSDALAATDISVTTNPLGTAALTYNNSTSTFTYTPPDLSSYATTASVPTTLTDLNITDGTAGQILSTDGAGNFTFVGDISGITLTDLSVTTEAVGTASLVYDNTTGVFTYTPPDVPTGPEDIGFPAHPGLANRYLQTTISGGWTYSELPPSGIALTDLSIGPGTAGNSSSPPEAATLSYDNTTGVFSFSGGNPTVLLTQLGITDGTNGQVLSTDGSGNFSFVDDAGGIALTDLSVTTATAGTAALAYDNSTGVFTFTPPDVSTGNIEVGVGTNSNLIQTISGSGFDLILDSATGITQVDDNLQVTGSLTVTGSITVNGTPTFTGNITANDATFTGHVLPSATATYNLGAPGFRWSALYAEASVFRDVQISATASNIISTTGGSGTNLVLSSDSSTVEVQGNLTVTGQSTLSNVVPDSDNAKDLGSSSVAWKDFYIKGKINGEYSLPATDGSAGQTLTTDGAGSLTFATPGGLNFVSITDITTSNQTDLIYAGLTVADDASFVATKLMVYYNGSLLVPGTSTPTYDFFVDSGTIGAESNGWRINLNFTPLDGSTIVVYRLS